jgi:hypothetical protein
MEIMGRVAIAGGIVIAKNIGEYKHSVKVLQREEKIHGLEGSVILAESMVEKLGSSNLLKKLTGDYGACLGYKHYLKDASEFRPKL